MNLTQKTINLWNKIQEKFNNFPKKNDLCSLSHSSQTSFQLILKNFDQKTLEMAYENLKEGEKLLQRNQQIKEL